MAKLASMPPSINQSINQYASGNGASAQSEASTFRREGAETVLIFLALRNTALYGDLRLCMASYVQLFCLLPTLCTLPRLVALLTNLFLLFEVCLSLSVSM